MSSEEQPGDLKGFEREGESGRRGVATETEGGSGRDKEGGTGGT